MGFSFEQLDVWKMGMKFAHGVIDLCENLHTDRKHFRLVEQLESASLSVPQNIAEGKGRFGRKEFIQFLFIARGSLFETVTLLTLFKERGWCETEKYDELMIMANRITGQINALIDSIRNKLNQVPVSRMANQPTASGERRAKPEVL